MKARQEQQKTQEWSIDKLKPHPRQAEFFSDLSEHELQRLADNMDVNGLDHPVEILPDGTLITGHQRVLAAKLLGWKMIAVIIRDDLAQQGDAAVEERLICDNLDRRQLTSIEIARCYRRLKLLKPRKKTGLTVGEEGDVRDQLAKRFNVSGRTLDRYERVLDTPLAVQNSVARGELVMAVAEKVANLSPSAQESIAKRISGGEKPQKVIRDYLPDAGSRRSAPPDALQKLVQALRRGHQELGKGLNGLESSPQVVKAVPVLRKGRALIDQLLERLVSPKE